MQYTQQLAVAAPIITFIMMDFYDCLVVCALVLFMVYKKPVTRTTSSGSETVSTTDGGSETSSEQLFSFSREARHDINVAIQEFEKAVANGLAHQRLYNLMGDRFSKLGDLQQCKKLLETMQNDPNVQVTAFNYNTTLHACSVNRQWQEALSVFRDMVDAKIKPDLISFNTLLNAMAKTSQWKPAMAIFNEMPQWGVTPDKLTLNTTIRCCVGEKKWELGVEVFEYFKKLNIAPDMHSYGAIIDCMGKSKRMHSAREYYNELINSGETPTLVVLNAMLCSFCVIRHWREAAKFLGQFEKYGVRPNIRSYTYMIKSVLGTPVSARAVNLLMEALECGLFPSKETYDAMRRSNTNSDLAKLLNQMQISRNPYSFIPNLESYAISPDAYNKAY